MHLYARSLFLDNDSASLHRKDCVMIIWMKGLTLYVFEIDKFQSLVSNVYIYSSGNLHAWMAFVALIIWET